MEWVSDWILMSLIVAGGFIIAGTVIELLGDVIAKISPTKDIETFLAGTAWIIFVISVLVMM